MYHFMHNNFTAHVALEGTKPRGLDEKTEWRERREEGAFDRLGSLEALLLRHHLGDFMQRTSPWWQLFPWPKLLASPLQEEDDAEFGETKSLGAFRFH